MTIQIDLSQLKDEAEAKKRKVFSATSNWASILGDPCLRYLVYMRTKGHERPLYDTSLQYIFSEGKLHEKAVLRDIENELGLEIKPQYKGIPPNPQNIAAVLDAEIKENNKWKPLEVKSISHFKFLKLTNNLMDLIKSPDRWMQRYPAQMQIYLLMNNIDEGILIFKDKLTGKWKQFNCILDYEYAETLLKKAEAIEKHLKEETLPERIQDNKICETCDFYTICLPETIHEGTLIDDPELEEKLNRREELKKSKDEYEDLDKEIKIFAKGKEEIVCGDWILKGKLINKKGYEVKPIEYWETRIRRIK